MRNLIRAGACVLAAAGLLWMGTGAPNAAGALAIGSCAAYGYAYDYPTLEQAREAAMAKCDGACKKVVTTKKGCVAFAVDTRKPCKVHGYAKASRLGAAQNTALKACYKQGGRECMIRAWICDANG